MSTVAPSIAAAAYRREGSRPLPGVVDDFDAAVDVNDVGVFP